MNLRSNVFLAIGLHRLPGPRFPGPMPLPTCRNTEFPYRLVVHSQPVCNPTTDNFLPRAHVRRRAPMLRLLAEVNCDLPSRFSTSLIAAAQQILSGRRIASTFHRALTPLNGVSLRPLLHFRRINPFLGFHFSSSPGLERWRLALCAAGDIPAAPC